MPRIQVHSASKSVSANTERKPVVRLDMPLDLTEMLRGEVGHPFLDTYVPFIENQVKAYGKKLINLLNRSWTPPKEYSWVYKAIAEGFFMGILTDSFAYGQVKNSPVLASIHFRSVASGVVDWSKVDSDRFFPYRLNGHLEDKAYELAEILTRNADWSKFGKLMKAFWNDVRDISDSDVKAKLDKSGRHVRFIAGLKGDEVSLFDTHSLSSEEEKDLFKALGYIVMAIDKVALELYSGGKHIRSSSPSEFMEDFASILHGNANIHNEAIYEYVMKHPRIQELCCRIVQSWSEDKKEKVEDFYSKTAWIRNSYKQQLCSTFGWNKEMGRFEYVGSSIKSGRGEKDIKNLHDLYCTLLDSDGNYTIEVETDNGVYQLENFLLCDVLDQYRDIDIITNKQKYQEKMEEMGIPLNLPYDSYLIFKSNL